MPLTALLILSICAAVILVLFLPFRRARALPDAPSSPSPEASASPGIPDAPAQPATGISPPVAFVPERQPDPGLLLEEKDRLFQALADLRFDYEAGKLSREDFEEEDARLRGRAAEVLRGLGER